MNRSEKTLRLPHDQRPFWESRDPHGNLQYLGWGLRDFGNYPTGASTPNWCYNLILRGSPLLRVPGGSIRLTTGQAVILSPGTEAGFRDKPHRYTELLVWFWRLQPSVPALRSLECGHRIFDMSVEARKRLRAAHLRCRQEVEAPDELTAQLLHSIRFEIDAEFARSLLGTRPPNDQQWMVETAVRWMQGHLHLRDPIYRLCHYLQVSPSTLERVFDAVLHTSPAAHYLELRMQAAQKRLREGKRSIKQIAYELGYKHPGNFGRAFKAFQRQRSSAPKH